MGAFAVPEEPRLIERQLDTTGAVTRVTRSLGVKELRAGHWVGRECSRADSYRVDLSKALGQAGYQWRSGVLNLEQNPEVHPLVARGFNGKPGLYYGLLAHPQVEGPFEDAVAGICSAPLSLVDAKLPRWDEGSAHAALCRLSQKELADRLWYWWTRPESTTGLRKMRDDFVRSVIPYGFYIGEIVARPVIAQLPIDKHPRLYWLPWAEWRAPWSLREWLLQDDKLVGVVLSTTYATDAQGRSGKEVCLDADKILTFSARSPGRNYEGRSSFRSAQAHVGMLGDVYTLEALSSEVNGLGTLIVTEPEGGLGEHTDRIDKHLLSYKGQHVPTLRVPFGTKVSNLSPQSQMPELGGVIGRHERAIGFGTNSEGKLVGTQKHGSNSARGSAIGDQWAPYAYQAQRYVVDPFAQLIGRAVRHNHPDHDLMDRIYTPTVHIGQIAKPVPRERVETLALAKDAELLRDPLYAKATAEALGVEAPDLEGDGEGQGEGDELVPIIPLASALDLLTTGEAASMLQMSPSALLRWTHSGDIKPAGRKGAKGGFLYRVEDLAKWIEEAAGVSLF